NLPATCRANKTRQRNAINNFSFTTPPKKLGRSQQDRCQQVCLGNTGLCRLCYVEFTYSCVSQANTLSVVPNARQRDRDARAQGRFQRVMSVTAGNKKPPSVKFCGFGITFAEISFCTRLENSIKETTNIMKPKQIFISILAVLFVFPLLGTFAQQV